MYSAEKQQYSVILRREKQVRMSSVYDIGANWVILILFIFFTFSKVDVEHREMLEISYVHT